MHVPLPSSFRDDAGFVFEQEGVVYRQVNAAFGADFEAFRARLLPAALEKGWVLPFEELPAADPSGTHTILRPLQLPFISYPFEWPFSALKEAALLTLDLALLAEESGMELRDATPYNLQWVDGKMQHIDHLSFGLRRDEGPWRPYRQFCEAFLAPLALMHYAKTPLQALGIGWMEGVPLPLARKWLPWKSRLSMHLLLHLHIHGSAAAKRGGNRIEVKALPGEGRKRILQSLQSAVRSLQYEGPSGRWSDYYDEAAQRGNYLQEKERIITYWLEEKRPERVFDAGANEGHFSLLAARDPHCLVIAGEPDHFSVQQLYHKVQAGACPNMHPLLFDFAHPSPAIGLNGRERPSLFERVHADLVLALAVVHHLFFTERIPFTLMGEGFRRLGRDLLIEWVPPEDEKVRQVGAQSQGAKENYSLEFFLTALAQFYLLEREEEIGTTGRRLYYFAGR